MPDEYFSMGGKLKFKGDKAADARVDKKKKKKAKKEKAKTEGEAEAHDATEANASSEAGASTEQPTDETGQSASGYKKTAAEQHFDEMRKKRLHERVKREGFKTHKQRVEELNKYLSRLSEHHDMPKIGPG
ncbi:hypothetical protein N7468_002554 [Penicillium chermesinum]|uniref:DUF1754-domain-containing protein n=1 Tax=Penicillium chermesinum TaxID=63820 RepID=A0A9W9PKD7_9EURO|nr:uncharacterized protein N7468_002554 [Penicillium chermesinum]KAJ5247571.1 hypothetical protein N7468_002554 [Penicillium chermesinum]